MYKEFEFEIEGYILGDNKHKCVKKTEIIVAKKETEARKQIKNLRHEYNQKKEREGIHYYTHRLLRVKSI